MKPTAQELWEEIEVEIQLTDYPPYRVQEFISLVQTYAQTYHEEEMDKFQLAHYVGVTHDNRLCFTDPQNPGAIIILNQPNQ